MANELLVGVKIGAMLSGSFHAAFGSAKSTLERVGQVADRLSNKHQQLGTAMAAAMAKPISNIGALRGQYDRLGQTMDQLRRKQDQLTQSIARGDALKNQRKELRSDAMETVGTALAIGAPVAKSVQIAASFEDAVKDIAITGDMTNLQELQLGKTIRESALKYNQGQLDIAKGVGVLVAEGMDPAKAEKQSGLLAKSATSTRASFEDLARMNVSFDQLGVKDMELAFNQAAKAGKQGSFELKDMAKWFPALGGMVKSLGITGNEAVVNMASRLQIARRTAGSNDEAANNFKNFLSKLTSPDTQKDFEKVGIDLGASLLRSAKDGLDPIEAGVNIIMARMKQAAPGAAAEMQKLSTELAGIKDPAQRAAEMERRKGFIENLGQRAGLGEMFQDMQAMSYLLAELQNRDDLKKIKKETATGKAENGQNQIDVDWERRMQGSTEKFRLFKRQLTEVGIVIGETLLPPLTDLLAQVQPVVSAFGKWAQEHPGLIKGAIGLAGGLLLGKLGFIGLKYGLNLIISPFNAFRTLIIGTQAKWLMLRGLWQAGTFAPAIAGLKTVGGGLLTAGRYALLFGRGLAMSVIMPVKLLGQGLWLLTKYLGSGLITGLKTLVQWGGMLGRMLGGALLGGLRLAGQAVLWLGRALLMNPIGLFVTAIGVAAYLVYKNWDKVRAALQAGYQWVVGLKNEFFAAGGHLISGLMAGITAKLSAAKDAIVGFGQDIKGWFTSTLGIKSPSRVFMGFGDNIAQGAAQGVGRSAGLAGKAVVDMARVTASSWVPPVLGAPVVQPGTVGQMPRDSVAPAATPEQPSLQGTLGSVIASVGKDVQAWFSAIKTPNAMPPSIASPVLGAPVVQPGTVGQMPRDSVAPAATPEQPSLQGTLGSVIASVGKDVQTWFSAIKTPNAMPPSIASPVLGAPVVQPGTVGQMPRDSVAPAATPEQPSLLGTLGSVIAAVGKDVQAWFSGIKAPNVLPRAAETASPYANLATSVTQSYQQATPTQLGIAPPGASGGTGAGMVLQYSPTYQLAPGTPEAVKSQIQESAQLSMRDLEKLLERMLAEKMRRAY